jgi:hypothetical protein
MVFKKCDGLNSFLFFGKKKGGELRIDGGGRRRR